MTLFEFLENSPTAFHAVQCVEDQLNLYGFVELEERERWQVMPGGSYYVKRNDSSIIAFTIGAEMEEVSFRVTATHSDSPAFKVKENAMLTVQKHYLQLNTEGYGGMLCSTWFDRPLSIAGRVVVKEDGALVSRLFRVDRDLLVIPSMAIHMNRKANEGVAYNKQVDMLPLFGQVTETEKSLEAWIAESAGVNPEEILGQDVFLYNRMKPTRWGAEEEFISAPRLDDLQCAYATLQGFLQAESRNTIQVYACFDNEEVGSETRQGAGSSFLNDALERLVLALGYDEEDYRRALADSYMISADNAHAVHPNHPEKTDSKNCVYMNEGVVVKSHAGQKYASDAISMALCRDVADRAMVPLQFFANRSDEPGGSTLGNIAISRVPIRCADVGLAQLAMHSAYETAGARDVEWMTKFITEFYQW